MWSFDRAPGCALLLLGACAVPLDGEPSEATATPAPDPAVAPACRVESASWRALQGPARPVDAGAEGRLWLFDGARERAGGDSKSVALLGGSDQALACLQGADERRDLIEPRADGRQAAPLEGARVAGASWLYVALSEADPAAAFGVRAAGVGLARWDEGKRSFVVQPTPLWAPDAPSFGESVLVDGGFVHAYGCRPSDFLESVCLVARVPEAEIDQETSYTYYAGSGRWTPDLASAAVIFRGFGTVSVRRHEATSRYVAVGFGVLSNVIEGRSGLTPAGPWSRPYPLARCETPSDDKDAFCTGISQLDSLGCERGVAVSHGVISLAKDAAARLSATPEAYASRIACVEVGGLP